MTLLSARTMRLALRMKHPPADEKHVRSGRP
jgi:hypothetical protein